MRYSAVFWLVPGGGPACESGDSPWYRADAIAGNADAQDALGELHQLGRHGYARDAEQGAYWSTLAAEQGHAMAQSRLGRMLLAGEGITRDVAQGIRQVSRVSLTRFTLGASHVSYETQFLIKPNVSQNPSFSFDPSSHIILVEPNYSLPDSSELSYNSHITQFRVTRFLIQTQFLHQPISHQRLLSQDLTTPSCSTFIICRFCLCEPQMGERRRSAGLRPCPVHDGCSMPVW